MFILYFNDLTKVLSIRLIIKTLLLLSIFVFLACSASNNYQLTKAIEATEAKDYERAIKFYQKHVNVRLAQTNRPKWENPYIYYLDIGDLYLKKNDPNTALTFYLNADEKKVESGYVNDRLRFLAEYYYKNNQKQKAIEHLKKYKSRDPLIFGLMLNRIAQQILAEEIAGDEISKSGNVVNGK